MSVCMSSFIFVTVHCDFEWKRVFFIVGLYLFCRWWSNYQEGKYWDLVDRFNHNCTCYFLEIVPRTWISIGTFLGLFCVHWFEMRVCVRFVGIGGIVDYHYLNFLFITSVKFVPCFKHLVWCCTMITKLNGGWINLAPYINIPILHKYIFIC